MVAKSVLPSCAQLVNVTVLEVNSTRSDSSIADLVGHEFTLFINNGTSVRPSVLNPTVWDAVSKMDWCPLADKNVLNMKVRANMSGD